MSRFMALIAALAVPFVLVAPSAAAPPAGSSVQIEKQATFVSPTSIVVSVVVQCPAGESGFMHVFVSQQQTVGPNRNGSSGPFLLTCDGTNQTFNVLVSGGPFTPGDAFASARLTVPLVDTQDQRVITIS